MAAESDAGGSSSGRRGELDDAPPFLTWRAIYVLVLGALAVEIALGAVLTAILS